MARSLTIMVNGRTCHPNYSGDISFTTTRENDERYYRTVLDTDLVFTDGTGDYSWIVAQAFDTEFKVTIVGDDGFSWDGVFYKTDCTFNADDRQITVKPDVNDLYKTILDRMDDSYDVIKLAPKATAVNLTKRAVLQIYVVADGTVGDNIVTNWCGNMTWEETATAPTGTSVQDVRKYLINTCHFSAYTDSATAIRLEGANTSKYDGVYIGEAFNIYAGTFDYVNDEGYIYRIYKHTTYDEEEGLTMYVTTSSIIDGTTVIATADNSDGSGFPTPIAPTGYTQTVSVYEVYMRWLHDLEGDSYSYVRDKDDDITEYSLNYRYIRPAYSTGFQTLADIEFHVATSTEPTEYGQDEKGMYFEYPDTEYLQSSTYFPIAQSTWSPLSVWMKTQLLTISQAEELSVPYTLKDAYMLPEIIKALLSEMEITNITHEATADYSTWLYAESSARMPFIVPSSNVKKTYYSNPAQKGELSLRNILDMLRDCFNVYWFIDGWGRLRLEHVSFFMSRTVVMKDITAINAPRNFNPWSFGQNSWTYDKVELPERVEFSYSENQTSPFTGCVLKYNSNYVQKGEIDKVSVTGFLADVDYAMEYPSGVSDDSWVILLPVLSDGTYSVQIGQFTYEKRYVAVQNPRLAWVNLFFDSLRYNMSCPELEFNGKTYHKGDPGALTLKRIRKQKVVFPWSGTFDPYSLIRTGLSTDGNDGEIQSLVYTPLSSSAEATLYFNTEN